MLRMWCAVALAIAGCTTVRTPSGQPSQAVQTASPATETAERWIRVSKAERMLYLYEGWQVVKSYPVVFGKDPVPAKLYEGDNRTPEGTYHIQTKYYHPYWSRFMLLDYPTPMNWEVYEWSRTHRLLPRDGNGVPGIGGAVGIHGSPDDALNRNGVNWTRGCISLLNRDVDELYDLVPVGARVVIER
jgi:lipoprotein-anchoring transpeptidase ErfK/SrfK